MGGGNSTTNRTHNSSTGRIIEPVRWSDSDNPLTYFQIFVFSQWEFWQILRVNYQQGQIRTFVVTDQFCFKFTLITQDHFDIGRRVHHMIICQNITIGINDQTGTQCSLLSWYLTLLQQLAKNLRYLLLHTRWYTFV